MAALTFRRVSELLPYMCNWAPGCPDPLLQLAARAAAIEYCERTRCWRHLTEITVTEATGVSVVPSVASIHEIERAEADGVPLIPTQHTEIQGELATGAPVYISQVNPQAVAVHPWPGVPVVVNISMFLKPRYDIQISTDPDDPLHDRFDVLPDWIVSQYGERIADGGLARVLIMQQSPWFNPQLAAVHQARFEASCNSHFRTNLRGQQRAPVRTTPHNL